MTRDELVAMFRVRAQDTAVPYLHSNELVYGWLREAEQEAAIRGRLLHESDSDAVCEIAFVGGTSTYSLNPVVYEITNLRLPGHETDCNRGELYLISTEELDRTQPGWRAKEGQPRYAIQGETDIRLVPRPLEAGKLRLECYRLPRKDFTCDAKASPEIHAASHKHLVDWALYRAFEKPDSETYDHERSVDAEAALTDYFGMNPGRDLRRSTREDQQQTNKVFWA